MDLEGFCRSWKVWFGGKEEEEEVADFWQSEGGGMLWDSHALSGALSGWQKVDEDAEEAGFIRAA